MPYLPVKDTPSSENRQQKGGRETRPEFLVLCNGEPKFLFECTVAAGPEFGGAHQKRINRLYDALDRVQSTDFFIGVQVIRATEIDPPGRSIRRFVERQLCQLQVTAVSELIGPQGQEALPEWRWENGGWEIVLFPILKEPEYRGTLDVRPLGIMMSDAKKLNTPKPLLDALHEKASKYGEPAIPYVIAIDGMEDCANQESIASALFGGKKWQWNDATGKFREVRPIEGFWYGSSGPTHQRVSGILFVPHLEPSRIAENDPVLWHNPWANHPIDPRMWLGSQMVQDVAQQKMTLQHGKSAAELFGLDPSWPGWDDDHEEEP